jgi:hypothetical protein
MFCITGNNVLTLDDINNEDYQIKKYKYSLFFKNYNFLKKPQPYSIYIPNYGYYLPPHINYNPNFKYCDNYKEGYYYTLNYGYTNGKENYNLYIFFFFIILLIIIFLLFYYYDYLNDKSEPNILLNKLYNLKNSKNLKINDTMPNYTTINDNIPNYSVIKNTENIFKEIKNISNCKDLLKLINSDKIIDRAIDIKSHIYSICDFSGVTSDEKNILLEYLNQIIENKC